MADTKTRILLIDRHPEWLDFAQNVLSHDYEVKTFTSLEEIIISGADALEGFDLTFIGLELATVENLDTLKSMFDRWRFIVIFPVFREDTALRLLFRSGIYDCARQPYDREGLLALVAEELTRVQIFKESRNAIRPRRSRQQAVQELVSKLQLEEIDNGR